MRLVRMRRLLGAMEASSLSVGTSPWSESLDAAVVDIGGLVLCAPQEDADLSPVHEDEALGLVGDVGAHAAAHNAVPGRQIHLVKLRLDDLRDVVKHFALLEGERHAVHRVLLHLLVHVRVLYDCILGVLLVNGAVRLDDLRVRLALPALAWAALASVATCAIDIFLFL